MTSPRDMLDLFAKTEELLGALQRGRALAEELLHENARMKAVIEERSDGSLERRLADLEAQNDTLASLYVASCQLHRAPESQSVPQTISEILAGLIGASDYAVFAVDEAAGDLLLVAGDNVDGMFPEGRVRQGDDGVEGRVAMTGVAYFGDPTGHDRETAVVPLRARGRVEGVVGVYRLLPQKRHGFTPLDFELLTMLSSHGGLALSTARLYARATLDSAVPAGDL